MILIVCLMKFVKLNWSLIERLKNLQFTSSFYFDALHKSKSPPPPPQKKKKNQAFCFQSKLDSLDSAHCNCDSECRHQYPIPILFYRYLLEHATLHPTEKYYPLRPEFAESTYYLYQATKGANCIRIIYYPLILFYLFVGARMTYSMFIYQIHGTWRSENQSSPL